MHIDDDHPKVMWLREHPDLWATWPDGVPPCTKMPRRCHDDEPDVHHIKARWRMIVAALKHAGLASRRSWAGDVHVPALVLALRRTRAPTPCDLCRHHHGCMVAHVHRRRRTTTTR